MKLSEAIDLERKCESLFRQIEPFKGYEPTISMALAGRLRLEVNDWFFTFDLVEKKVYYFKFYGYKEEFDECITAIEAIINDPVNARPLELLLWSYRHQSELEQDVQA